jgi:deazaflavin-dependent oxidoreductase (nitroreductase family)
MTGRRSGRKKTIALMYTRHGEDVLLVASLGGSPAHPVWYHNLKAQPQIEIQAGRARRKMLAREAPAEEKRALWPVVVANYPSFDAYQKRTTREIPLFICSPRSG